MKRIALFAILLLGSGIILSCSKSTKTEGGTTGTINLYLTDAPADFESVNIVIAEVSVHMAESDSLSGWQVITDSTQHFDLLKLRNGASTLFASHQLPPGKYTQIRLKIGDGSNVVIDSDSFPLEIPSGYQTGIKLNHAFTIILGEVYELLLDFDAERSIVQTGNNQYKLKPVIRLIPMILSGDIKGVVIPHDVDILTTSGSDTISVTKADTLTGLFKIIGLLAGQYDLKFTPQSASYADSTIYDVSVSAGQTIDLDTIALRQIIP